MTVKQSGGLAMTPQFLKDLEENPYIMMDKLKINEIATIIR
jgi:hypothetical protein